MRVESIFIGMRELLAEPRSWTQGTFARTAAGEPCAPTSLDAACWCVSGAAMCVARHSLNNFELAGAAVRRLLSAIGAQAIGAWNDDPHRTHAEVLAALDRAIVRERSGLVGAP